jgi:uncharacterized protein (DUF1778 family)
MPRTASPKQTAVINIACLPEERELVIRAAQISGYCLRPGSTHGFSTFAREVLLEHSRQVIADAEESNGATSKPARKRR